MCNRTRTTLALGIVVLISVAAISAQGAALAAAPTEERKSIVAIFNDGHRQSFPLAGVARIEFKDGLTIVFKDGHQQGFALANVVRLEFNSSFDRESPLGRNHFVGKWEVGSGAGMNFFITLASDGHATKTIGGRHGTWVVIDGEARITWEDGWHDAIRKVGNKHEKVAFGPGKSFSDEPDNVTDARNTTAQPI
jgi:hypothetical protein